MAGREEGREACCHSTMLTLCYTFGPVWHFTQYKLEQPFPRDTCLAQRQHQDWKNARFVHFLVVVFLSLGIYYLSFGSPR